MEQHIAQSVAKSSFVDIPCLCCAEGCPVKLTFSDIQAHATPEVFQRYDEGLLHGHLERNPEFCWCSRSGCGSGQLHTNAQNWPIVRCHECRFLTCFRHHCEWHKGRSCEQYNRDARKSEEVGLLQLLQDKSKFQQCPECGNGVEKNEGCDHMTCRCKHEFCWRCLAPYKGAKGIRTRGRKGHKKSCRHYRK